MRKVVIVGAGVIGLFCAVRLAKLGARVTVLEAEGEHASEHGPAASAAAAGMLAPLEAAPSPHERLALASFDLWRRLHEGAEWADGVSFDGAVVMTGDAESTADAARNVQRLGRAAHVLSAGQARKRLGLQARLEHALLIEDEGVADPLRVLSGLAMQARAHGVIIDYSRDAANATANAVMTHDDDVYEADSVVLAPGAWATEKLMQAAPALRLVRPAKGHLAAVKLERPLGATLRTPDFYLAQRREDIVLGSTMELDVYDRRVDQVQVEALAAAAEATLPGEVKLAGRAWAGIRPMSPDGWPMVGPTGDGVLVAAGHSRNGWLMAPITAEIVSAYVMGGEIPPDWAALSPARFEDQ